MNQWSSSFQNIISFQFILFIMDFIKQGSWRLHYMLWCTTPPGSFCWSTWLQLCTCALSLHLQAAPNLYALTCLKSFTCSSGPLNLKNEWKHELKSGEWGWASAFSSPHHCWQHHALYMTTVTSHYPVPVLHPCTIFSSIIHQSIHPHTAAGSILHWHSHLLTDPHAI